MFLNISVLHFVLLSLDLGNHGKLQITEFPLNSSGSAVFNSMCRHKTINQVEFIADSYIWSRVVHNPAILFPLVEKR